MADMIHFKDIEKILVVENGDWAVWKTPDGSDWFLLDMGLVYARYDSPREVITALESLVTETDNRAKKLQRELAEAHELYNSLASISSHMVGRQRRTT